MPLSEEAALWRPMRQVNPKYLVLQKRAAERMTNPNFSGEWKQPVVDNPDFKGYLHEAHRLAADVDSVGVSLDISTGGVLIDNIYLSSNTLV